MQQPGAPTNSAKVKFTASKCSCQQRVINHSLLACILPSTLLLKLQLRPNSCGIDINAKTVMITEQSVASYPGPALNPNDTDYNQHV